MKHEDENAYSGVIDTQINRLNTAVVRVFGLEQRRSRVLGMRSLFLGQNVLLCLKTL